MGLYKFYRISKPAAERVAESEVGKTYRTLRNRTFWGATAAYSLFYLCRLSMGVVKKPLIDEGLFSAAELGVIASAFYFVYAIPCERIHCGLLQCAQIYGDRTGYLVCDKSADGTDWAW